MNQPLLHLRRIDDPSPANDQLSNWMKSLFDLIVQDNRSTLLKLDEDVPPKICSQLYNK